MNTETNEIQRNSDTESSPKINNGGVTPEIIARWKQQNRKVYEITITDDGERFSAYFKRPSMETLSAMTKQAKSDELKGANVIFENCWLGGAQEIKEDAVLRLATFKQLNVIVLHVQSEIKNM